MNLQLAVLRRLFWFNDKLKPLNTQTLSASLELTGMEFFCKPDFQLLIMFLLQIGDPDMINNWKSV